MALIKCADCGREISSKATSCPFCGCPVEEIVKEGVVRVKMPNNIVDGLWGALSGRDASVLEKDTGKVLWEGHLKENAKFTISEPTRIVIQLGGWANPCEGIVEPRRKYTLIQDTGMHWLATYVLTEVDVIDAD